MIRYVKLMENIPQKAINYFIVETESCLKSSCNLNFDMLHSSKTTLK